MPLYAFVFLGAAVVALLLTPLVTRLAYAFKLVDRPGIRKVHTSAVPRIGGVAVVVAILAVVLPLLFYAHDNLTFPGTPGYSHNQLLALLGCCTFIFLVGLVDDIWGLRARIKLLAQVAAALVLCYFGVRAQLVGIGVQEPFNLGAWSWPLTVFWIVGLTNAVNLIDGLDGLAAGISAIACAVIAVFAFHSGQLLMAVLMLAALGSLTGFLFFNFSPARVFLGDCGSMFLGFFLAGASVLSATKSYTMIGLAMPALALGLPIFDTLFSMLRRIMERRSLFAPDRNHIHHRLIDMGLNQRHAVILMYVVTLLAAGIGMFMMVAKDVGVLIIFGCALLPLLLVFRVFGAIRLRETFAAFRRNLAMAHESKEDRRDFEEMQLRLRQAKNFAQWWKAIRRAARELGFARLCIRLDHRDGTALQLRWRLPSRELAGQEMLTLQFPVRQRRLGLPSGRGEAEVPVNGILEGAGRRLSLFARLLDECGVDQLAPSPRETAPTTEPAAPDTLLIGGPQSDPMPRTVPASARKP